MAIQLTENFTKKNCVMVCYSLVFLTLTNGVLGFFCHLTQYMSLNAPIITWWTGRNSSAHHGMVKKLKQMWATYNSCMIMNLAGLWNMLTSLMIRSCTPCQLRRQMYSWLRGSTMNPPFMPWNIILTWPWHWKCNISTMEIYSGLPQNHKNMVEYCQYL